MNMLKNIKKGEMVLAIIEVLYLLMNKEYMVMYTNIMIAEKIKIPKLFFVEN